MAFNALHQSTGSLIGSDGYRRLLLKEGIAYTLCFGPPLIFCTPNLADTRQPLLLVVQGEEFRLDEELPSYREMVERLAQDPAGQAVVFELMIQLFFEHVLGVRPDLVGFSHGTGRLPSDGWFSDGCAAGSTGVLGCVLAARGEVEAQGRGSLHPHILVWLVQLNYRELLRRLKKDRHQFKALLRKWMEAVVLAVLSRQQSSVLRMPTLALRTEQTTATLQSGRSSADSVLKVAPKSDDTVPKVAPLPLGPNDRRKFGGDGLPEQASAEEVYGEEHKDGEDVDLYYYVPGREDDWELAVRPKLPLRNAQGEEVDDATWRAEQKAASSTFWTDSISKSAPGSLPTYRLPRQAQHMVEVPDEIREELQTAIPADEFFREWCHDARELVIGAAVHVCSASCWKYHSKGANHICRHGFYHVVALSDHDGTGVFRRRRNGKRLRSCIAIIRETSFGMAGRILTYQDNPGETLTNYCAKVCARCNIDMQDLNRTLPPHMWLSEAELEPEEEHAHDDAEVKHGRYPQRLRSFSHAPSADWGWMKHLGCTLEEFAGEEHHDHAVIIWEDWRSTFASLIAKNDDDEDKDDRDSQTSESEDDEFPDKEMSDSVLSMFVDAHNTGYYINSYTTKTHEGMDNVLRRLLDGLRRVPEAPTSTSTNTTRQDFSRVVQMLSRFETSFRRASWKSGCEMAFPMLFGHLSFSTHRCWTVFMRRAVYLAHDAWRHRYGQIATTHVTHLQEKLQFKLPDGTIVDFDGWSVVHRDGKAIYVSSTGEECDAVGFAEKAMSMPDPTSCSGKAAALRALSGLLRDLQEGGHEESEQPEETNPASRDTARARYSVYSQLQDYLFRGSHPLVRDMSLYVYSMWVYRVEVRSWRNQTQEDTTTRPRYVDIPFDFSYPVANSWVQRISTEPRVPRPEGMQFVTVTQDPELNHMLKGILLRPLRMPEQGSTDDSLKVRELDAFAELCVPSNPGDTWPALHSGPGKPGPFQLGFEEFLNKIQPHYEAATVKSLQVPRWPSLWETQEMQEEY